MQNENEYWFIRVLLAVIKDTGREPDCGSSSAGGRGQHVLDVLVVLGLRLLGARPARLRRAAPVLSAGQVRALVVLVDYVSHSQS